jgi:hypothetical protein
MKFQLIISDMEGVELAFIIRLPLDFHIGNVGSRWAQTTPVDHPMDILLFPLQNSFNLPIGAVSHPTGDA